MSIFSLYIISLFFQTLSQNKIMEGCTSPLVVKFADTQKEKEQKKIQQIQANLWNLATNINIPLGQTATSVSTPILPNPPQQPSPVMGADALTPASIQLLQQLQTVGLHQQLLQGELSTTIYAILIYLCPTHSLCLSLSLSVALQR